MLPLVIALAAGSAAVVGVLLLPQRTPPVSRAQPATATVSTTRAVASAPAPALAYVDVIRAFNPAIAATQPLGVPLDLSDAAHLIVHDPLYLDGAGMLWITHAGGASVGSALAHPQDPPEHVVGQRIVFVHWWLDDDGEWRAAAIGRADSGGLTFITATGQTPLPASRNYRWSAAFSWQNRIVVPADLGVSVFDCGPRVVEHYHALPGASAGGNGAVTVLDTRGVLAWSPWENGRQGSCGASRFVDGTWSDLAGGLWASQPIQLLPLLDGSVLQISRPDAAASAPRGEDAIALVIAPLDQPNINTQHISDLVTQLDDPDDQKREAAFAELSRYGPGLAPVLEQMSQDQPPETRLRVGQLLRARVTPALDGIEIIDNRLAVARRQEDGTVLLFAPAGVRVPRADADEPEALTPAWICVRSGGRLDPPLLHALVGDQQPGACTLFALRDDWLVCDGAGVRRFMGTAFEPVTAPAESRFTRVMGQDRRGRWIIGDANPASGDTLIIDPTIADPAPRLPAWAMTIDGGATGWDRQGWPVIQRGGAWALRGDAWVPLGDHDPMLIEAPATPGFAMPATNPASQPASQPAALGAPLLCTADGTCYFDGQIALTVIDARSRRVDWPLPASAVGSIAASLVRTADGSLYLYNQPGRIVRLQPTRNPAAPFRVSATFTRGIPNTDRPTRMWLDPLGRIDFVYDKNQLVILFPAGFIPPEIAKMMPG